MLQAASGTSPHLVNNPITRSWGQPCFIRGCAAGKLWPHVNIILEKQEFTLGRTHSKAAAIHSYSGSRSQATALGTKPPAQELLRTSSIQLIEVPPRNVAARQTSESLGDSDTETGCLGELQEGLFLHSSEQSFLKKCTPLKSGMRPKNLPRKS